MVENEFKVMLTEEQYNKIREMYSWDDVIEQTNYYYDTDELALVSAHITCRVRSIGDELFLQMKLPGGAVHSRIELEQKLCGGLPDTLGAAQLSSLCGREDMPDAALIGALSTTRYVKKFDGAEVDLDKSSYFSKTDYELEIEFTDEEKARMLMTMIKQHAGVEESEDVCSGKVHRFLAQWRAEKV